MEGVLKHFTHDHPLILFKYNNSPADVLCYGCGDPIITNTYVYRCSNTTPRSNASQDSSCTNYFLHKTCSTLPPNIQHDLDIQHMQTLRHDEYRRICDFCEKRIWKQFFYKCTACYFDICLKCSSLQRDLNHASHNHTLTLLPLKSSHFCRACGTDEGGKDFSYLCKTCLFWIHNRCASAPPKLIFKSHAIDHPLVLDYSIPEEYRRFGVLCNLCCEVVDSSLWLYYCAFCRYFAHIKCVLSATESGEDRNINEDVGDVDDPDLVHFPVSEDNPSLLYQLIQKFAKNFSTSTDERSGGKADKIRHCGNGHSLVLFDELNNKNVAETESSESMICDGCVQPILSPPDSFYGCIDCNFFLHTICAAELPKEIQHASHPQHKLIRCDRMSKPNAFFICGYCENLSSGMFYRCDSCEIYIDLVCAAMPSEIKHDAHKHKLLYHIYSKEYRCAECSWNNQIDVDCARKPGRIKHRWDEHQLCLMYPPVKGHPHDFNCERCSEDINPNRWFYHCHKCDTSFHDECLDQVGYKNIKFGAIVKDDDLHQHSLKISPPVSKFKCGSCGIYNDDYRWTYFTQSIHTSPIRTSPIRSLRTLKIRTQPIRTRPIGTQRTRPIGTQRTRPIRTRPIHTRPIRTRPIRKGPILTCVSCKFSVCYNCTKL